MHLTPAASFLNPAFGRYTASQFTGKINFCLSVWLHKKLYVTYSAQYHSGEASGVTCSVNMLCIIGAWKNMPIIHLGQCYSGRSNNFKHCRKFLPFSECNKLRGLFYTEFVTSCLKLYYNNGSTKKETKKRFARKTSETVSQVLRFNGLKVVF